MKANETIESLGVLLKEETLQSVEHYVLENTMVLESIEPFPGYHGENQPTGTKPDSLFLITDKAYSVESVFRTSQHLCCDQNVSIDACPVEILMMNSTIPGIRIRGLSNYSHISAIQRCYLEKGFHFAKFKTVNASAVMRITKIFNIEELDNHIFSDKDDAKTFYLAIPYHFNWNLFKGVTKNVKNNMDNSNFDCASGFIYMKEMKEFVRVYAENIAIGKLQLIREKYLEEIARIRDDAL